MKKNILRKKEVILFIVIPKAIRKLLVLIRISYPIMIVKTFQFQFSQDQDLDSKLNQWLFPREEKAKTKKKKRAFKINQHSKIETQISNLNSKIYKLHGENVLRNTTQEKVQN